MTPTLAQIVARIFKRRATYANPPIVYPDYVYYEVQEVLTWDAFGEPLTFGGPVTTKFPCVMVPPESDTDYMAEGRMSRTRFKVIIPDYYGGISPGINERTMQERFYYDTGGALMGDYVRMRIISRTYVQHPTLPRHRCLQYILESDRGEDTEA